VSCPGWLDPERKAAALASSTIFILPSYAEGMPMALLEAMSWEMPVIATPVGGIPQVVENGVNGLLVAPGDIDGLAAAIRSLLEDTALCERLGAAARATVETGFSLNEALAKLSGIYDRFGIAPRGELD
jgi:glycosyltransferase involved in cell wall biosynthesis